MKRDKLQEVNALSKPPETEIKRHPKSYSVIVYRDYKVTERFKVRVNAEDESAAMKLAEQAVENGDDSAVLFGDIDRFDIQVEADENNIREVHNRTKAEEEHHILLMKAIMNSGDKE